MFFEHSPAIWSDYPELVAGAIFATGITRDARVDPRIATFTAIADSRLAAGSESELPEIQAWRRAFSRMDLRPTQYRCASEALLRRYRKERLLPRIHPLVDLCNAVSLAFAIPVAALDAARISENLVVRYARGDEQYLSFSGEIERPQPHEVIFVDTSARVHARRWTNRQSAYSAVRDDSTAALIVIEGLHGSASTDVPKATAALADELTAIWSAAPATAILEASAARFDFSTT
ncbi:MAG TPA: phenylalanine--tRNA ligase beta subunit-related protein [Actinomycetes bacterium]|nr:phenylalanine--tRNA ligase beta subunit-related protein [Actinomycetes bacterium]